MALEGCESVTGGEISNEQVLLANVRWFRLGVPVAYRAAATAAVSPMP